MSGRQVLFMENKKEEHVIYFKDLIFAALHRWRAVLAVALIAAILLGGMQLASGLSEMNTPVDPAEQEEILAQREAEMAGHEHAIESARRSMKFCQAYLEEAPLMQLDPYCYYEAQLVVHVQTDYQILPGMTYQNPDKSIAVVSAYEVIAHSNATMEKIAEKLNTQSQYIGELLTITKPADTATLHITALAPTQQEAEAVLAVFAEQIDGAYAQVQETVATHTVTVVEQSVSAKANTTLIDTQKRATTRMTELLRQITDAQLALAALAEPTVGQTTIKAVIKTAVIWAVLGGVLGAFLTVAVLWVLHITGDQIYAGRNLQSRTGIKVIGTVGGEKKNPVDRLLYQLEGRSMDSIETAPVVTDVSCRAKGAKCLLVTGSGETAQRESLVKALSAAMPGVQVEDRGSILRDGDALKALAACDAVVLAETCGVSRYGNVKKQLDVVCDYGANLLGCVLMEN